MVVRALLMLDKGLVTELHPQPSLKQIQSLFSSLEAFDGSSLLVRLAQNGDVCY